jgi:hypothetical protein
MIFQHRGLGIQGHDHRCLNTLGKADQRGSAVGHDHAAVGHDHRASGSRDCIRGTFHRRRIGRGTKGGETRVRFVGRDVEVVFKWRDRVSRVSRNIQMYRARRAGGRLAKRLAQQMLHLIERFDPGVELGDRGVQRSVLYLLIGVTMLKLRYMPARKCDHRRVAEIRVLHRRSQVSRTYGLRHANARPARYPRKSIGHVSDRLLRMAQHPRDSKILHLGKHSAQHRVHEEHVRYAVSLQGLREQTRASHLLCHEPPP